MLRRCMDPAASAIMACKYSFPHSDTPCSLTSLLEGQAMPGSEPDGDTFMPHTGTSNIFCQLMLAVLLWCMVVQPLLTGSV